MSQLYRNSTYINKERVYGNYSLRVYLPKVKLTIPLGIKDKKKAQTIDGIAQQILDDNVGEKDWDKTQKFEWEKKYFDFYFNEHPFTKYKSFFYDHAPDIVAQLTSPKEIPDDLDKGQFKLYGIINKIIIKKSKKTGREFYKIALEDDVKEECGERCL